MTKIKGIDISTWQGKVSLDNFKKVKSDGIGFVILRLGYTGTSSGKCNLDDTFETNYKNAIAAGLPVGVYYYSGTKGETSAKIEAEFVLKHIKGKKISYPVYLDLEENKNSGRCSKETLAKACNAFCKVINAAGYTAGIYASLSWFNNKIGNITAPHTKWVAQYNSICTYKGSYDMWQYSSSGNIKGLTGRIDVNYCYKDFAKGKYPNPTPSPTTKTYTGIYPKLPARGYFKRGDKGTQVKYLQKFLNWYGEYKLVVDGVVGSKTIITVEKFQKAEGLDVDGLFGRACLKRAKVVRK